MTEDKTAREWGFTPSEFRRLSYEDRVEMVATDQTLEDMSAVESEMQLKKLDKDLTAARMKGK